ncbi:metallophosphoesterase [Virgibacillus sp. NKC19-3]|uniref:metallophosphoesterase family protein n=1 Tax=Virgibacillus saliphilus TaxID=2831674 RepID=UPI001C9B8F9C|nr:metallophosphoesterase [Virgibacillus sp. NKC19-3]MBY7143233.1 metallophosphoesterase [Virgibacillus sp. NKC19-3]
MTKVLILSDSHGLRDQITEIKERHHLKHMIHCGDSELDMDAMELDGFIKVGGNTDHDTRFPEEQILTIDGLSFFVTHGHLHQVKANLMTIGYRAEEMNAKVICFGHTHIAGAEQIGEQLFINPGSIRLPRNRSEKTYAIMEFDRTDDITVTFHTVDRGDIVEELTYHASL